MTDRHSRQSQFDIDQLRAHNVLHALQEFAVEARRRHAVAPLREVIENRNKDFKGGYVKQAPEYFTEKYLIEPVLEQLALDPWPRPVDLVKDERNRPDYRLQQIAPNCLGIAESKALNRERRNRRATEDIKAYLDDDTFLKTLRREKVRYSIGVASDGLEWRLIAHDTDADVRFDAGACSIVDPIETVLMKAHSEVDPDADWMPGARRRVADTLVATFSRENIVDVAIEGLSDQ